MTGQVSMLENVRNCDGAWVIEEWIAGRFGAMKYPKRLIVSVHHITCIHITYAYYMYVLVPSMLYKNVFPKSFVDDRWHKLQGVYLLLNKTLILIRFRFWISDSES